MFASKWDRTNVLHGLRQSSLHHAQLWSDPHYRLSRLLSEDGWVRSLSEAPGLTGEKSFFEKMQTVM